MNHDYCGACGNKIEFSLQRPKFCPHCGALNGGTSSASTSPVKNPIARKRGDVQEETVQDDETNINALPSMASLQYELDGNYSGLSRPQGNLADLLKSGPLGGMGKPTAQKPKRKATAKKKSRAPGRKKTS